MEIQGPAGTEKAIEKPEGVEKAGKFVEEIGKGWTTVPTRGRAASEMSLRGGSGSLPGCIPPAWRGSGKMHTYGDYIAVPGKGLELKDPAARETVESNVMREKSSKEARGLSGGTVEKFVDSEKKKQGN